MSRLGQQIFLARKRSANEAAVAQMVFARKRSANGAAVAGGWSRG
ncbi:hypothetical protein [Lysinibacillus xylanilyticus]